MEETTADQDNGSCFQRGHASHMIIIDTQLPLDRSISAILSDSKVVGIGWLIDAPLE